MIKPTAADIGRRVLYRSWPEGPVEVGTLQSLSTKVPQACFVVYGPMASTPRLTYCAHLTWESGNDQ